MTTEPSPADVVVVQTIVPHYRVAFFELLAERLGPRLLVVAGDEDWTPELAHVPAVTSLTARNRFLLGRRLLWQSDVLGPSRDAEVAVLVLNPRILSAWAVLALRRLRGRRTLLWGHAWPRRGRTSPTDRLRRLMRRLSDGLVVYTEAEAEEARADSPRTAVVAAPNALYRRAELERAAAADPVTDLVFVGRLVGEKRPDLLLDAFLAALPELPDDVRLVFVGDGPLRPELEAGARAADAAERVFFRGHVSAFEEISRVYAGAIASVLPGTAGLTLVQSLGFGVPVVIARDARHGPEIDLALEGVNARFFAAGSQEELASTLVAVAGERGRWREQREVISAPIRDAYTVESMVEAFLSAVRV